MLKEKYAKKELLLQAQERVLDSLNTPSGISKKGSADPTRPGSFPS